MKCKYCNATLDEDTVLCPECGAELNKVEDTAEETAEIMSSVEENAEAEDVSVSKVEDEAVESDADGDICDEEDDDQSEDEYYDEFDDEFDDKFDDEDEDNDKPTAAWWKVVLLCAGVLAALILFVCIILKDQGIDPNPLHWFGNSASASEDQGPSYRLRRKDYTADADQIAEQSAKVVAKVGDAELDNAQLQIYYWSGVYEFINSYQYYMETMGLDLAKPLSQQTTVQGDTWQKFFLENALYNWHKMAALAQQAEKEGFKISDEQSQSLEQLPEQLKEMAESNGYESVDAMLIKEMGPLCTMDSYIEYMRIYYLAVEYFNTAYEKMDPTEEELEAYFAEHEEELAGSGITKDSKIFSVRHILIEPEGGQEDENGQKTYSEAEWEACRKSAQAMLDKWKTEDGTEDGFAVLARDNSADGGSSTNGGLYTDLTAETNFVPEFKEWYLDADRQVGDTGLVKTTYGYHIMYFSAAETNWQAKCREALVNEMSKKFVEDCMESWPIKLRDRKIAIGDVTLVSEES